MSKSYPTDWVYVGYVPRIGPNKEDSRNAWMRDLGPNLVEYITGEEYQALKETENKVEVEGESKSD